MPKGYGYGNARLRAMRSRLLTEADYNNLLACTSINDFITALTDTLYKDDVETALVRVGGIRCVLEALRTNLTRTLGQVVGFFDDHPRTLVELLLSRWDRHNLLTILRGQSREVSADTMLAELVPVGQLDEVSLRELVRQPGLRAALDLMTTWRLPYAKILRRVQAHTGTTPNLDQYELALNRSYYGSLREALAQGNGNHALLRDHFEIEIDLINLRTALKLAQLPEIARLVRQRYHADSVRPLLIEPGGQIPPAWLAELIAAAEGLEMLIRELSHTRYGDALATGWKRSQAGQDGISVLERELERWQAHRIAARFTGNPLSIAIPVGYVGCKEIEVANLRLIGHAVNLNLKREQIRRDLFVI